MLSAKKLTEGVTIMCIFLISAHVGGLATPSEGPGATVGARARGKETAYTLLIYIIPMSSTRASGFFMREDYAPAP